MLNNYTLFITSRQTGSGVQSNAVYVTALLTRIEIGHDIFISEKSHYLHPLIFYRWLKFQRTEHLSKPFI